MNAEPGPAPLVARFLASGGEVGARMRGHDWSASPLGDPSAWPQPLQSVVGLLLNSRFPMFVAWGKELGLLYNEAYAEILGAKHPLALGSPFRDVWAEIWPDISPLVDSAMAGEASFREDLPLVMNRRGFDERTWFTFSYSPVRDEDGRVAGMFCAVAETTSRVLAERRQALLVRISDELRDVDDPHTLKTLVAELLGHELGADRAGYGTIDASGQMVSIERDWSGGRVASLASKARLLDAFGAAEIEELRAGRTLVVEDRWANPRSPHDALPLTREGIEPRTLIVAPLISSGRLTAILYVHSKDPRRWTGADAKLVEEVAKRSSDAIERAWAQAELRESEDRFRFLDRLGEATVHAFAPREIMAMTAELLGRHLRATRCAYADVDADNDCFTIRDDWANGVPSSAGEYSLDLFGSRAAGDMRSGRTLVVRDVDKELALADGASMFNAIGIKAIICCPLVKEGRLVAMMAVHQASPRDWTSGEISLLVTVVERAWAHIERVRAEAALRESESRFRLMADAVPQIVWITSADGRAEFYNEQWFAYTGAHRGQITAACTIGSFVHPDDAATTTERFEEARRTGSTFLVEHRLRSKRGDYRWFLVRGEPQRNRRAGQILRWFGASVDIHDRKSNEEANARLAAIVASTTDAIIAFAAEDGRILAWNRGAEELFGYAEAEALGGPVGLLVPPDLPDGDPSGVFRRAMEGVRVHEHETARMAKSGQRIPVAITASRMVSPCGRAIGVAAIFRDLRQRKAVEARQALLSRELDHRAKNALAVVQAALRLTRAPDLPSYVRAITGRVDALARAQTLLADEQWAGADLRKMLTAEMDAFLFDAEAGEPRVTLDGPTVALPAGIAQPLAMVVHEFATNATKHGALSAPGGRVAVIWSLDGGPSGTLRLRWSEGGGPPITAPPARRGFGTRVLEGVVRGQLRGALSLAWNGTGLVCDIEVPLARLVGGSAGGLSADQTGSRR